MSLVFAAITPHPPLLIPTIGKDEIKKADKTKKGLEQMEEDLYLSKPDTILVISPHGRGFEDAFTVNAAPELESNLKEFGDLTTKLKFKGNVDLGVRLHECAEENKIPVAVISEGELDHGAVVPLFYLTPHLTNVDVLPVSYCQLPWKTHVEFGEKIKEQIMNSNKRVAIVASGDLSHALKSDAPAGYSPDGQKFDEKIQQLLADHNLAGMLQLDPKFVQSAAECGFRSFLILMGLLQNINYAYKQYAYEGPFGVGYLTANFAL